MIYEFDARDADGELLQRVTPLATTRDEDAMLTAIAGAPLAQLEAEIGGDCLLRLAARHNLLRVVRVLHERGVHLDAENFDGETALRLAAEKNLAGMVRLLCELGAPLDEEPGTLCYASLLAARAGAREAFAVLQQHGATVEFALSHPAQRAQAEDVARAWDCGARDVNRALRAMAHGMAEYSDRREYNGVAEFLLRHGADPSLWVPADPRGALPAGPILHTVARCGGRLRVGNVVAQLLSAGASPWALDAEGRDAFAVAMGSAITPLQAWLAQDTVAATLAAHEQRMLAFA